MAVKRYLLSLPERLVRSVVGVGAGVAREVGEVAIPRSIRQGQLYRNLVDTTLQFLIRDVGGVEGVGPPGAAIPDDFLTRRATGNVIEALGLVAFRASPVWVLAALSDACGLGRHLIPEIADALRTQGLLDPGETFTTADQLLDGLERTSSRMASTINTPPLDVATLRAELEAIRTEARGLAPSSLPSLDTLRQVWSQLNAEAARQERSVFETSTVLAVAAIRGLPGSVRRASAITSIGARRAGQVVGQALLDHYTETLADIRRVGYTAYARRQLTPYVRAAATQFSPDHPTLTERWLARFGGK
jgi:hypothetical protein